MYNIHPIAWINELVMEQSLRSNTTLRFEAEVENKAFVSTIVSFSAVSKLDEVSETLYVRLKCLEGTARSVFIPYGHTSS